MFLLRPFLCTVTTLSQTEALYRNRNSKCVSRNEILIKFIFYNQQIYPLNSLHFNEEWRRKKISSTSIQSWLLLFFFFLFWYSFVWMLTRFGKQYSNCTRNQSKWKDYPVWISCAFSLSLFCCRFVWNVKLWEMVRARRRIKTIQERFLCWFFCFTEWFWWIGLFFIRKKGELKKKNWRRTEEVGHWNKILCPLSWTIDNS